MLRPLVRWRTNYSSPFYDNIPLNQAYPRQYSTGINSKDEKVNVGHANFLAEAKRKDSWESKLRDPRTEDESELEGVKPGKGALSRVAMIMLTLNAPSGKLQPTSSHLFKVILPLATTRPPIVFLLHPSQPLSHLARLIASALPKPPNNIYFCAASDIGKENTRDTEDSRYTLPELGGEVQWADSTDIGDFTKVHHFLRSIIA
jgi:calcium uniporter protein, mitochondrial